MAFTDRDIQVADQASAGTTGQGGEAGQAISRTAIGGAGAPVDVCSHPVYLVPEWVRVRSEDFGLLFYDTRSTRLTFVRSGDRLVLAAVHGFAAGAERRRPECPGRAGAGPSPAALSRPAR